MSSIIADTAKANIEKGKQAGTAPQLAAVAAQFARANKMTMQRLHGGIAHDLARADLTGVNRFDLARFLKLAMPFSLVGKADALEYDVHVNTVTPLHQLLKRVGGSEFSRLEDREPGPSEARMFVVNLDKDSHVTLFSAKKIVEAYDLKLANAREMASFYIYTDGIMPYPFGGIPIHLCGADLFSKPSYPHRLFFECWQPSGQLSDLKHVWVNEECVEGKRPYGWNEPPRIYLVRRMTQEEIIARQSFESVP